MIEGKIDQLSNFIVRPRRRQYDINDLGPKVFKSQSCLCTRQDFQVLFQYGRTYGYPNPTQSQNQTKTTKSVKLQCSIFIPHFSYSNYPNDKKTEKQKYQRRYSLRDINRKKKQSNDLISFQPTCVLSMHGNTGTRVSTLSNLQSVLKFGLAFACFDFAGCGLSQGDYVTLGYYEKYQISAVLDHINRKYGYHKFILYGRSMGAASSLFYSCLVYPEYSRHKYKKIKQYYAIQQQLLRKQKKDNIQLQFDIVSKLDVGHFGYEIVGVILDSPYYDIQHLVMDLVKSKIWFIPKFLITYAIGKVSQRVKIKLADAHISPINERSINSQQQIIHNHNKQQEQVQIQNIPEQFCLLKSTKIPQKAYIPFPVFVMYGLKDDVILKQHTIQLFRRITSENKKLHVFQDQGHGDHRDDKVKSQAIEWILGFQYERVDKRINRDARLFGMDLQQYINWILNNQTPNKNKQKQQKVTPITMEKIKQISQITTQRTISISSLKFGQVHGGFGSLTSIDNYTPIQQQNKDKQQQIQTKTPRKKIKVISKCSQLIQQNHNEIKQQTSSQDILLSMSRIAPFKILRNKMGIQTISKPIKTLNISTPLKKQSKQIQFTNCSSQCVK